MAGRGGDEAEGRAGEGVGEVGGEEGGGGEVGEGEGGGGEWGQGEEEEESHDEWLEGWWLG